MEKKDMIYGARAVMEAIDAGREIEKILIQTGLKSESVVELRQRAKQRNIPVQNVPVEKLRWLGSRNHQGVVCILSAINYASLDHLVDQAYSAGKEPFLLMLDRITDVRNFGAIVRTAECAGVNGIVVPEKGSAPITSDSMKTSAGALNHVPVCRENLRNALTFLQERGVRVVACTEKAQQSIYDDLGGGPMALLLGSEEDGISDDLLRKADVLVRIPMRGKINSLNVSVAAGIAIFEVLRQRGDLR
jgi:23S rRNA (guanosine2251-2'-O)-methyltransferase